MIAAALVFSCVSSARAAVRYFTITLTTAPPSSSLEVGDVFQGSASYSIAPPTTGNAAITRSEDSSMTISLSFDGHSYNETDDRAYGSSYPIFYFTAGELRGISFEAPFKSSSDESGGFIRFDAGNDFSFGYVDDNESPYYQGTVTWFSAAPVPEPAAAPLALCGALLIFRRKRPR